VNTHKVFLSARLVGFGGGGMFQGERGEPGEFTLENCSAACK